MHLRLAVPLLALPVLALAAGDGTVALPGGSFKVSERGSAVAVQPFRIDATAVTAGAYAECVKAGRCAKPDTGGKCTFGASGLEGHPVNCVDWGQAEAYCRWAKKRLPTEEEREWAARGAQKGTAYPWGNGRPAKQLCWDGEGNDLGKGKRAGTCPAGSHPAGDSPQGVKGLAGNVREWTASRWAADRPLRVVRGGSWTFREAKLVAASRRSWHDPELRSVLIGFRCARSP